MGRWVARVASWWQDSARGPGAHQIPQSAAGAPLSGVIRGVDSVASKHLKSRSGCCLMSVVLAHYLHDLNPYVIRFTETFGVRWYGLAYVLGFVVVYLVIKRITERGWCMLKPHEVADFVTYGALLGVLVGGRLGYMVLHDTENFLRAPWIFFQINKGGMASHGGILGLTIYIFAYARFKGYRTLNLGDAMVIPATLGLFFGRLANFINGELFGRPASVPWAVKFPTEIHHSSFDPAARAQLDGFGALPMASHELMQRAAADPALREALESVLNPRHPSQIYQALMEGLLLFVILLLLRTRVRRLPEGLLTAVFFGGYSVLRIIGEMFREPDSGTALVFGVMSNNQFYTLFLLLVTIGFALAARRNARLGRFTGPGHPAAG